MLVTQVNPRISGQMYSEYKGLQYKMLDLYLRAANGGR